MYERCWRWDQKNEADRKDQSHSQTRHTLSIYNRNSRPDNNTLCQLPSSAIASVNPARKSGTGQPLQAFCICRRFAMSVSVLISRSIAPPRRRAVFIAAVIVARVPSPSPSLTWNRLCLRSYCRPSPLAVVVTVARVILVCADKVMSSPSIAVGRPLAVVAPRRHSRHSYEVMSTKTT